MLNSNGAMKSFNFADRVASCLLEAYDGLPKRGKPQGKEWTVLAGLVIVWNDNDDQRTVASTSTSSGSLSSSQANLEEESWESMNCEGTNFEVLALATGNRCVGLSSMSRDGTVVNDCHAEALVRRCLKHIIYSDIKRALNSDSCSAEKGKLRVLELVGTEPEDHMVASSSSHSRSRLRMRKNASLHLCITETPCGDASIYDAPSQESGYSKMWTGAKPTAKEDALKEGLWMAQSSTSPSRGSEPIRNRERHQCIGCLRTKSARSDTLTANRTLSMSCSDKIATWGMLGMEGSLLSHFVEPVRLATVVLILGHNPGVARHAMEATRRALHGRFVERLLNLHAGSAQIGQPPAVLCSTELEFKKSKYTVMREQQIKFANCEAQQIEGQLDSDGCRVKKRKLELVKRKRKLCTPCGFALCCTDVNNREVEVLVSSRGVPQGTTRGRKSKSAHAGHVASSALCKAIFFDSFIDIAIKWGDRFSVLNCVLNYQLKESTLSVLRYKDAKSLPSTYRQAKNEILANPLLKNWIVCEAEVYESFQASI